MANHKTSAMVQEALGQCSQACDFWVCPVQGQDLGSMILVGLLQFRFYDGCCLQYYLQ